MLPASGGLHWFSPTLRVHDGGGFLSFKSLPEKGLSTKSRCFVSGPFLLQLCSTSCPRAGLEAGLWLNRSLLLVVYFRRWTLPAFSSSEPSDHFFFIFIFFTRPHGLQDDLSSLTRDRSQVPTVKALSPNHWTAREFPTLTIS